ncbi:serine hydrolase domain-containing protein [Heyndrickxia acidicola]|uniref:Serine hydrolase n=1 Tax=Heyndrickxia acidicola TaxID=209389 RepID=A0ABU6MEL9_9BACI|nr:serine hydrolase domain-containing protein [Heyndrickxia acidicola]MED1203093.1 serine hydrolase [Heyndrickxia acidicola]
MKLPVRINNKYEKLNNYVASIQDMTKTSGAASLIIQNDCIVNEWYRGSYEVDGLKCPITPNSQFNVASVRKSYLGFAISVAVQEGRINNIDEPITYYLPELDKDLFRGTTIRHLLTHTDGVRYTERLFTVGTDWAYNNCGVDLLILLIMKLYDCSLAQLLEEIVFRPLGLKETGWRKNRNDNLVWQDESYFSTTGTEANLFVSARELAYWGYLHLVKGKIQGNQIINPNIFKQAINLQSPANLSIAQPRNGFLWFVQDQPNSNTEIGELLPTGTFQILGITGCICLGIPQQNVVAVRMYNQKGTKYDYLRDIKTWGNLVLECANSHWTME